MLKHIAAVGILCAVAVLIPSPVLAQTRGGITCVDVSGRLNEFILPQSAAPNDPFGRILGTVRGSLQGSTTAFLTSFVPSPNGDVRITVTDTFVTDDGDSLVTKGAATWTAVKPGFLRVNLTLAIASGTGRFSHATGSLKILGIGNNVGPGTGQFVQEYRGQICTPVQ